MDGYYKVSSPFIYIHEQTLKTGPGTLLQCDQVKRRELRHGMQEVTDNQPGMSKKDKF